MLTDNLVGPIEPMRNSTGFDLLALGQASDDRPPCLENPRPKGGILNNGERPLSILG
jgi:hypothetical protein